MPALLSVDRKCCNCHETQMLIIPLIEPVLNVDVCTYMGLCAPDWLFLPVSHCAYLASNPRKYNMKTWLWILSVAPLLLFTLDNICCANIWYSCFQYLNIHASNICIFMLPIFEYLCFQYLNIYASNIWIFMLLSNCDVQQKDFSINIQRFFLETQWTHYALHPTLQM